MGVEVEGLPPVPPLEEVPQFVATPEAKARRREMALSGSPIVQMLLGDAIGDAFGAGIEMQDAFWIRKNVTADRWPVNPVQKEEWKINSVRGMYTDDCEMTVGLMNGLIAEGVQIEADGMLRAWRAEWDLGMRRPRPAEPGAARNGHGSIKRFFRGQQRLEDIRASQAAKEDPGNAPPMRSLPLAFVADTDRERLCATNADATHPHPKARAASFLVAVAARWLIVERGEQQQVLRVSLDRLRGSGLSDEATEAHLERLESLKDYHTYGERFASMPMSVLRLLCGPQPCPHAWAVAGGADGRSPIHGLWTDAMRTAAVVLYLLKFHRGPLDVLLASIDVGGDVDSIAALCLGVVGGSAGLRLGEPGGLPWFLVEELEGVEYLTGRAKAFEAWLETQHLPRLSGGTRR